MENTEKYSEQSKRLINILKVKRLQQIDIVNKLSARYSIDASHFSQMVTGKRLITEDILAGLQHYYFINPDYIKGASDDMLDIAEIILEYAHCFAKEIVITENPDKKNSNKESERYLRITMDKDYYNYLIKKDILTKSEEETDASLKSIITEIQDMKKKNEEKYRKKYNDKNRPVEYEEYILIPKSDLLNIVNDKAVERPDLEVILNDEKYEETPDLIHHKIKLHRDSQQ